MFLARLTAIALFVTTAEASTLEVAVTKYRVQGSTPTRVLLVAFADQPVTVEVTVRLDEKGPILDAAKWWQQLEWSLRDGAGSERKIAARSIDVVGASRNPMMIGSVTQHRGTFSIGKLPAGNYLLRVRTDGFQGSDSFAIRKGDETPFIKDKYLQLRAERSKSFDDFKSIQLERADLFPNRADIWLELAARSLEQGTQDETARYYGRAIEVMEKNAKVLSTQSRKQAKELRQRVDLTLAHMNALQAALPYYFANRGRLRVSEEEVDGAMHYVLKDRRSGQIDRVIRP